MCLILPAEEIRSGVTGGEQRMALTEGDTTVGLSKLQLPGPVGSLPEPQFDGGTDLLRHTGERNITQKILQFR